jgi:uncharacterized membrane protein
LQAAVAAWWIGADEEGSITSMITRASAVGFISLAAIQSISYDAPTSLLSHPASAMSSHTLLTAAVSVLAVAAASAFLAWRDSGAVRYVAMAMSLAAVTYLTAILLDGVPFVLALCAGAAAITWFARDRLTEDGFVGSVALIAMAIAHVLQFEAPVRFALVTGLDDFLAATVSLLAIAGAFAMIAWRGPVGQRNAALGGAALTVMYACSAAIICAFPPGVPIGLNDSIADQLSAGQLGQSLLSAFWALIAFAAIIIGLRRQIKELRIGGLVLLMVAIGKIVFIDLASLDAAYRTISFIAVGGVLLAVAYAFQRLRVDDEPAAEQVPTEAS